MNISPVVEWVPQPRFLVTAPRNSDLRLRRQRLEVLFDDLSVRHPLTVVAAPSGYAKTSALAAWVQHAPDPKAWLTLTSSNATTEEKFLSGLITALHRIAPDMDVRDSLLIGELLPAPTGPDTTVERIIEMAMSLTKPMVVVIDDAHHAGPALAHGPLKVLAESCGGKMHFVVAGAAVLATWFNRFLASGVAGRVGSAELALTAAEIAAENAVDGKAAAADIEAAERTHATTGGWPIAVQMSRMGASSDVLPNPALDEVLTEYVASSVLGRLRPELAEFILAATICHHVDSSLATALTGRADSAVLLEECAQQGIFVDRYVGRNAATVYRWHELFAEQCRILLWRTDASRARELNRVAAKALSGSLPIEAIKHALAGGERDVAMRLLLNSWLRIVIESGAEELDTLCLQLEAQFEPCVEILLVRACCLDAMGDAKGSLLILNRARALDQQVGGAEQSSPGTRAFAKLFLAHDPQELAASSDAAQKAMREEAIDSISFVYRQFYVGWTELRLRRDPYESVRLLQSALRSSESAGLKTLSNRIRANLTLALTYSGDLTAARKLMDTVPEPLPLALADGWSHYDGGIEVFARAFTDFWQDRLPEAKRNFTEMTRHGGHQNSYTALARLHLALCAAATGDARVISEAEAHVSGIGQAPAHGVPWQIYRALAAASLRVAAGEEAEGLALLAEVRTGQNIPVVLAHSAEIYRVAGRHAEAMAVLSQIEKAGMVSYVAVSALVTSAVISRERGDREEAHRQLERALDAAAPHGVARPFAGRDEALVTLLTEHAAWGTAHEGFLASRIIRSDGAVSRHAVVGSRLTSRELEVLGYLRTTMTAEEIAAALFVSVNTVRTHQRSIYRKLGVRTRREAIRYRP